SGTPNFDPGSLPATGEPGFPRELDPGDMQEAPPFVPPQYAPPDGSRPEGIPPGAAQEAPGIEEAPVELTPINPQSGAARAADSGTMLAAHQAPRAQSGRGIQQMLDRVAAANEEPPVADPVHDLEVTEITLNKMLTGGMNRDQRNGDEGIMVVVEPRNPKNQIVPALGEISIVVLDPALEGEAARVARWDITSQELEHKFRSRQFGRGLQLALPWPGDAPQHSDLHLFVRFVAADGRKLIVDRELKIEPPGGGGDGGWVPVANSAATDEGPAIELPQGAVVVRDVAVSSGAVAAPTAQTRTAPQSGEPTLAPPEPEGPARTVAETRGERLAIEPAPGNRGPSHVAQATKDEPRPAPKKRPQWSPYRK
ncbi:MAG: hypothetical protein JNG90_05375, partial [Planctomycetaceae bacterium]|nr:hypothetical protein [Planctomycetaceae bacterium]